MSPCSAQTTIIISTPRLTPWTRPHHYRKAQQQTSSRSSTSRRPTSRHRVRPSSSFSCSQPADPCCPAARPTADLPDSAYDLTSGEAQQVLASIAKRARDDSVLRTGKMRERDERVARRWDEVRALSRFSLLLTLLTDLLWASDSSDEDQGQVCRPNHHPADVPLLRQARRRVRLRPDITRSRARIGQIHPLYVVRTSVRFVFALE